MYLLSSHAGEGAEMKHCLQTLNEETYFKREQSQNTDLRKKEGMKEKKLRELYR